MIFFWSGPVSLPLSRLSVDAILILFNSSPYINNYYVYPLYYFIYPFNTPPISLFVIVQSLFQPCACPRYFHRALLNGTHIIEIIKGENCTLFVRICNGNLLQKTAPTPFDLVEPLFCIFRPSSSSSLLSCYLLDNQV